LRSRLTVPTTSLRLLLTAGVLPLTLGACAFDPSGTERVERAESEVTSACTTDWSVVSTFPTPKVVLPGPASTSWGLPQLVDFDRDGLVDFVFEAKMWGQKIGFFVKRGDGNGDFAAETAEGRVGFAGSVAAFQFADFDGDGRSDVLARLSDGRLQVAMRRSDGDWDAPTTIDASTCSLPRPGGLVTVRSLSDINGDGRADLQLHVVSADSSGASHADVTLLGTAQGLGAPMCHVFPEKFGDAFGTQWFELRHSRRGDFDADGKVDLVGYGGTRTFWAGLDIEGTPRSVQLDAHAKNNRAYGAVVGRFDDDGVDDAADLSDYGVQMYYGDPGTPFVRTASFDGLRADSARLNTGFSTSGDFNGDGRTDFLFFSQEIVRENGKRVSPIVCSTAQGKHARYEPAIPSAGDYVRLVGVADVDGDGRDELVLREQMAAQGGVLWQVPSFVVLRK
jgi:hypothetical protein